MQAINSTVYIDEAGDLGINRGTQWFVLSAVIVDKADEPSIRAKLAQIKTKLNVNEIHIRNMREFNKRAYTVNSLKTEKFTYINVITDTSKFAPEITPLIAYNYICRILLERVSWYLRDTNSLADIILSSRGTSRDNELIDYIKTKLIPFTDNQVVDMFLNVKAKSSSQWDLLQLADVCATTMFLYHEINDYGFRMPCFAKALSSHLYEHNKIVQKYGIKYFKDSMKPSDEFLKSNWICVK